MIRTVLVLVAGSGGQALANAGSALLATKFMPPAERGEMVLAFAIASLVSAVCGVGSGVALRINLPGASSSEERRLLSGYSWLSLVLIISSVGIGVSVAAVLKLGGISILMACGVASAVLLMNLQLAELRFAVGEFKKGAYWATFGAVLGFGSTCVGLTVGVTDSNLLFFQMGGLAIGALVNGAFLLRRRLIRLGETAARQFCSLVTGGFSPLIWTFGLLALSKLDRIALSRFENAEVVAAYALGVTFAEAIRLFPTALSQLVTREAALGATLGSLKWHLVSAAGCATVIGVVMIPASSLFVDRFLDPVYRSSVSILAVLVVGEVFMALYLFSARCLQGYGAAGLVARIAAAGALVGIPLFWLGGSVGGAIGIAVVLSVSYVVLGAGSFAVLVRRNGTSDRERSSAVLEQAAQ